MTEPASTTAATGGILSWLPWVGVIAVAGIVGGALGFTGVFGHPVDTAIVSSITSPAGEGADASSCPGGAATLHLSGGQAVFAVARTDDAGFIGIRNPYDTSATVWVPKGRLTASDFSALPVSGCGTAIVAPEPVAEVPVAPATPVEPDSPPPPPPADTTAPTIGTPVIANSNCYAKVTVSASDNVGVTSVTISLSGSATASGSMSFVGGQWQYEYYGNLFSTMPLTATVVAHDGAGNSSPPASTSKSSMQCIG